MPSPFVSVAVSALSNEVVSLLTYYTVSVGGTLDVSRLADRVVHVFEVGAVNRRRVALTWSFLEHLVFARFYVPIILRLDALLWTGV